MQKVNQCFIRKSHPCGKIFGGSKSCFIACPSEDESKIVLELISSKLANLGIEPYIATNERAYGQDIFCTKICGKIIESQFCMVLLDDKIKTITAKINENIPNPNVYYEYGLMTALKKHIIPLQKDGMDLAFNIQSYDTIKYNDSNLGVELEKAIKTAVEIVEKRKISSIEKVYLESKEFKFKMEINGFKIIEKPRSSFIRVEGLEPIFGDTGYYAFINKDKEILLLLMVVEEKNNKINLDEISVLDHRIKEKINENKKQISQHEQERELHKRQEKEIASKFYFRSSISPEEIEKFKKEIQTLKKIYLGFLFDNTLMKENSIQEIGERIKNLNHIALAEFTKEYIQIESLRISLI